MGQFIWTQSDLIGLAQHTKAVVRRWACGRMKSLYGKAGVGILERLLRDKEKSVLMEALDYLEDYLEPGFNDTLLEIYRGQRGAVASKAAVLLGKLKDERFLTAYQKKRAMRQIGFDDLVGAIDSLGELATEEARTILRENLSEISKGSDSIFVSALIRALLQAGEDLSIILDCYARHYESSGLDILYPLASVCGSWYSLEDLKDKGKRKLFGQTVPYAVSGSLSYLKKIGFSTLAKDIKGAFKKEAYRQVIEVAWRQAEKVANERGVDFQNVRPSEAISPPLVNYRVLWAIHDFLNHAPEDSLRELALVTNVILSNFMEFRNVLGLKTEAIDPQAIFKVLFEDRGGLRIDDMLLNKSLATLDHEVILARCLLELRDHPSSYGTGRAIGLLRKLEDERALPELFDFLKKDGNQAALEECIRAIAAIGIPSVNYVERNFDQLDEDQILEVLFALESIPVEETADLVLHHWDKFWSLHKEPLLGVVEKVGSKRFIESLRKELRDGEALEEEVFYLLCHIHGVDDILIPQIEKSLAKREKEVEGRLKTFEKDPKALLEESINVELKCLQCHKSYHYDVENVYVPKEKGKPQIGDKIVCKNCGSVNRYEITPMGQLAITSHLVMMVALAEKGEKLDPEQSPIKMVETGLTDGRRMSFDEAFEYYRKEIERSPQDPALRVGYGNMLMKKGDAEEALLHYREALRLDPTAVEAYCCIGEYEGDRGNNASAYKHFKKAADCMHTGHYYRTKDPDQLKEAIFDNLEHLREILGKRNERTSHPPTLEIVKMEKVGRNAPCPCGSGKKYKKCCLDKEEGKRPDKTSVTPQELELRDQLVAFSGKERYRKDFQRAYRLYWRKPWKEPLVLDEEEKENFAFFLDWFVHDFTLKNGLTVIEEFYHDKKDRLSPEDHLFRKGETESYVSIYEVTSVTPGEGLRLKDLLTDEEIDIFEVRGSRALVKWDLIFARVIRMGSANKLSGIIRVIPRRNKDDILASIRSTWERIQMGAGVMEWPRFVKSNAHLVHRLIEDQKPAEPVFVTEELHRIASSKAVFDVINFDAIERRLSKEFDFIADEGTKEGEIQYVWLKRGESKVWETGDPVQNAVILSSQMIRGKGELRWSSLGTIVLTPRKLELWCVSRERLDRGKKRLQEVLGSNIKHRIDHFEDIVRRIREKPEATSPTQKDAVPEEFFPVYSDVMGEWVTRWVDEIIPALSGKTPREAVQTAEGREKVEEILKNWENIEERKRRDGEPYMDVSVVRKMLNL